MTSETVYARAYKGVIFDLYGTLVDSFRSQESLASITEMAATLEVPRDEFGRLWRETFSDRETGVFRTIEENIRHVCQRLGIQRDASQVTATAELRLGLYRRSLVPRPGSVETLAALRSAGFRIGLVSNASAQTDELWRETSMAPLVDMPVFSCEVGMSKPDPRIYHLAFEGLELAADACLFVGDGGSGELEGARRVGLHPVLIRVPGDDLDDPHRPEAKEWQGPTVSAISEVLDLVTA